jgi:hypothetical protein
MLGVGLIGIMVAVSERWKEETMNAKRNLIRVAAVLLAVFSSVALAQEETPKYTLASLCGDYGAVVTYGANIAAGFGHETYDGKGNATGSALANQPGANGTRTITRFGISGTYTVNKDGSGVRNLTIALPGGGTAQVIEDFVITRAKVIDGVAIATEIADAQREPSAVIDDQSLVRHTLTLRSKPGLCGRESIFR